MNWLQRLFTKPEPPNPYFGFFGNWIFNFDEYRVRSADGRYSTRLGSLLDAGPEKLFDRLPWRERYLLETELYRAAACARKINSDAALARLEYERARLSSEQDTSVEAAVVIDWRDKK